jgi:hypothetical protein
MPLSGALVLLLAVFTTACNSSPQFNQLAVTRAENDISLQMAKKGFTVEQFGLVKESDRRLSGFIKVKKTTGLVRPEITKHCTADMDKDNGSFIWECK